jgi:hypothetical protein
MNGGSMNRLSSKFRKRFGARTTATLLLLGAAIHLPATAQSPKPDDPETVLATFHVKPGQLPAFLSMMAEYQDLLKAKSLVTSTPFVLLQGDEDGKPVVVELFTWKSHDIPDHAPPEVKQYWTKMNAMVEKRGGHDGIEFSEMSFVPPHPASS